MVAASTDAATFNWRNTMIRLGLLTAILGDLSFKEVVDFAAENNIESLEVACWPASGGAKRRYVGGCKESCASDGKISEKLHLICTGRQCLPGTIMEKG